MLFEPGQAIGSTNNNHFYADENNEASSSKSQSNHINDTSYISKARFKKLNQMLEKPSEEFTHIEFYRLLEQTYRTHFYILHEECEKVVSDDFRLEKMKQQKEVMKNNLSKKKSELEEIRNIFNNLKDENAIKEEINKQEKLYETYQTEKQENSDYALGCKRKIELLKKNPTRIENEIDFDEKKIKKLESEINNAEKKSANTPYLDDDLDKLLLIKTATVFNLGFGINSSTPRKILTQDNIEVIFANLYMPQGLFYTYRDVKNSIMEAFEIQLEYPLTLLPVVYNLLKGQKSQKNPYLIRSGQVSLVINTMAKLTTEIITQWQDKRESVWTNYENFLLLFLEKYKAIDKEKLKAAFLNHAQRGEEKEVANDNNDQVKNKEAEKKANNIPLFSHLLEIIGNGRKALEATKTNFDLCIKDLMETRPNVEKSKSKITPAFIDTLTYPFSSQLDALQFLCMAFKPSLSDLIEGDLIKLCGVQGMNAMLINHAEYDPYPMLLDGLALTLRVRIQIWALQRIKSNLEDISQSLLGRKKSKKFSSGISSSRRYSPNNPKRGFGTNN